MEAKDRQELFDRAYRRELSESEQLAFDALLKSDHSVKEQYEAFVEDVMLIEAASFRNQVGEAVKGTPLPKAWQFNRVWLYTGLAAAVIIIGFFIFAPNNSDQKLFEQYFQPLTNVYSSRSADLNAPSLTQALEYYKEEDYKRALNSFDQIRQPSDTIVLYKAVSHLSLGQAQQALAALKAIPESSNLKHTVNWYRGLAFLLAENRDSCQVVLRKIPTGDANKASAEAILKSFK